MWKIKKQSLHFENEEEVCRRVQDEATQWDFIPVEFAMKVMKKLGQKAAGIDGVSNDLLKCFPWEGVRELLRRIEDVERIAAVT